MMKKGWSGFLDTSRRHHRLWIRAQSRAKEPPKAIQPISSSSRSTHPSLVAHESHYLHLIIERLMSRSDCIHIRRVQTDIQLVAEAPQTTPREHVFVHVR